MTVLQTDKLPTRATLWHDKSTVLTGSSIVPALSGQIYRVVAPQTPAANSDSFTQSFWLRAGTYTFYALGVSGTDCGQIDWYVDNVRFVTAQEWYAASTANNVIQSASVSLAADGYHALKGVVSGKNASSSGFFIRLAKMWLKQTSD